ncbi:hypothetical protein VE04_02122 [Pseudogymnoascus sp. 24MN13]|nr:hypothetical protein VE04_02122 [Pseudogymnoascus sp. 24MN13]
MKFSFTLLCLSSTTLLVDALTTRFPYCIRGLYYCANNRSDWCGGGPAIAICVDGNDEYKLVACCGTGGCKYIGDDSVPYCV